MSQKMKTLIVGAEGFNLSDDENIVRCFSWSQIDRIKNISDYDNVVVNLLTIDDQESRKVVDWQIFMKLFKVLTTWEVLIHGGNIVVAGDPRFEFKAPPLKPIEGLPSEVEYSFLGWTGLWFKWDNKPGTTNKYNEFSVWAESYIKYLNKWDYSLEGVGLRGDTKLSVNKNREVGVRYITFYQNRYKKPILFQVHYGFIEGKNQTLQDSGPLILLPKTSMGSYETIEFILCKILHIKASLSEPEWISNWHAPGLFEVDVKINSIQDEINDAVNRLNNVKEERKVVRGCLKLLYESKLALEPVVHNILRELGAKVEETEEDNKEDGLIKVEFGSESFHGVLEIKSTKSDTFNEGGLRQLVDWVDRVSNTTGIEHKGIFIGNSATNKPPTERSNPFGNRNSNWIKTAKRRRFCGITTIDLYHIYILHKHNSIDLKQFWKTVFSTDGVLDMQPYLQKIQEISEKANPDL